MINLLIDDQPIPLNSSFNLNESLTWIRPKSYIRGFAGNMIYHTTNLSNMLRYELSVDGWIPSILSSLSVGQTVLLSPSVPISYTDDNPFLLEPPAVKRSVEVFTPAKTSVTDVIMEVRDGVSAMSWEHTLAYAGQSLPPIDYTYKLCYITFEAIVTDNSMSFNRDGYGGRIVLESTMPVRTSNI